MTAHRHFRQMKALPFVALLGLCLASLNGQTYLSETFSGGTVNSSNWQTLLPFGSSSVSQSGGFVTLTDRGTLLSQSTFSGAVSISGTFTLNSDLEHFKIAARTDGSIPSGNSFAERTGIIFAFSNDGDQISIQQFSANGSTSILALASYNLVAGQSYNFTATLISSLLTLSVDGVTQLSATDSTSTGNQIALFSRSGFGASTSVDSISVSAIPEPSTYAAIAGSLVFGLVIWRRKRSAPWFHQRQK